MTAQRGGWLDAVRRPDLPPAGEYALRLADDALVLAQRTAEWVSAAPEMEEDVALANIALDLLGQARSLLTRAGELEGRGRDEDALASHRTEREFVNCQLVELPNGDFARTMARLLVFAAYQVELYSRLTGSADEVLAAVAAKAVKEVRYHRDHATQWVVRLGDGTAQSAARMQAGLDAVWPHADELFEADELTDALVRTGVAVDPSSLLAPWSAYVGTVVEQATLVRPDVTALPGGGRRGIHTEALAPLLAELQHIARSHPGARW